VNELYEVLRVYTNFFLPSAKLIEKTREGSRVTKKYDKPKTPYLRAIESNKVEEEIKQTLKDQYEKLNPAELKRDIDKLQKELSRLYLKEQRNNTKDEVPNTQNRSSLKDNNFVCNFNEATK
jgi:hypothetical protein